MNPVEAWFHILKNSATFTEVPADLDPRLSPVMEAARVKKLSPEEMVQYFRSMVSEEDKKDIAVIAELTTLSPEEIHTLKCDKPIS